MKFLSILPLASVALATISNITVYVKSDNSEVNNLGVSSIHEGAAINYLLLGSSGQELLYNSDEKTIYQNLQTTTIEVPLNFTVSGGIYQVSVAGSPISVEIADDGKLEFDGEVYAAKNISDPYNYSERSYFLIDHEADGSIPVTLYAKFSDDNDDSDSDSSNKNDTATITSFEGGAAKASFGVAGFAAIVAGLMF